MPSHRRQKERVNALIWEYLDGEISEKRCGVLSRMLERDADAREQLIESAVLHGMLGQHFDASPVSQKQTLRQRRRAGRSSAA